MMKKILIVFVCVFIIYTKPAYAIFKLAVSPQTSRIDINFGRIRPTEPVTNQEIKIEVTNDTGQQYRIIQQASQPLTNPSGKAIAESSFLVYAAQTASYGIYKVEIPVSVTTRPIDLYTSDSNGQGVSFLLVYGLNLTEDASAGRYTSSITYTLEPLSKSGNLSAQSITLNVYVEVEPNFKMTITTIRGKNRLNFRYTGKETEPLTDEAILEIKTNLGSRYQIYQQLSKSLIDESGSFIESDNFTFYTSGATGGILTTTTESPVSNQQTLIYTSDPNGPSDSFKIFYNLRALQHQRAGLYAGVVTFTAQAQEATVNELIDSIEIYCKFEPIFKLSIIPQEGTGINFGHLKEKAKQTRYITLEVISNLGEQYQITQEVSGILMDRKGVVISQESFLVSTDGGEKGQFSISEPLPVKEGSTVLYISNKEGEPDKITVVYQLSIPPDTPAGDYTTGISYSLSTL